MLFVFTNWLITKTTTKRQQLVQTCKLGILKKKGMDAHLCLLRKKEDNGYNDFETLIGVVSWKDLCKLLTFNSIETSCYNNDNWQNMFSMLWLLHFEVQIFFYEFENGLTKTSNVQSKEEKNVFSFSMQKICYNLFEHYWNEFRSLSLSERISWKKCNWTSQFRKISDDSKKGRLDLKTKGFHKLLFFWDENKNFDFATSSLDANSKLVRNLFEHFDGYERCNYSSINILMIVLKLF